MSLCQVARVGPPRVSSALAFSEQMGRQEMMRRSTRKASGEQTGRAEMMRRSTRKAQVVPLNWSQ